LPIRKNSAVISSHRINYIGSLDPINRDRGLKQLGHLLSGTVRRWSEVEFVASVEIGNLTETSKK